MIENFNPFITLGGKDKKVNDMAYAALEMNKECTALKKELSYIDTEAYKYVIYFLGIILF